MLSNARMSTAGVRRDRDRHQGVSAEKILYIWNIQPYAVLSQAGTVHPEGRAKPELGEPRPTDVPPQGRRLQQKEPAAAQRADGRRGGLMGSVASINPAENIRVPNTKEKDPTPTLECELGYSPRLLLRFCSARAGLRADPAWQTSQPALKHTEDDCALGHTGGR